MGTLKDGTYNGWTNYATWRVNLEMLDDLDLRDMGWHRMEAYDLGQALKDWCEEMLEMESNNGGEGLLYSYAMAFLSDVNWYEIAKAKLSDYEHEETDEDETEEEDA